MRGIILRMRQFLNKTWRIVRWPIGAVALFFLSLFTYHLVKYPEKSREAVVAIHAQKLTMDDVDGKHLPPPPDPNLADATVEGIDANKNGIRDDVELAIFKKYPNDLKTRAAALQYAMTEQMFLTKVFNTATWKAVAEESGRANICIADVSLNFKSSSALAEAISSLVLNNASRVAVYEDVHKHTTSYGAQDGEPCDISV